MGEYTSSRNATLLSEHGGAMTGVNSSRIIGGCRSMGGVVVVIVAGGY